MTDKPKLSIKSIGYFPYLIFGLALFSLNSQLNINYFLKGYLSILELQLGTLLIYYLIRKLKK